MNTTTYEPCKSNHMVINILDKLPPLAKRWILLTSLIGIIATKRKIDRGAIEQSLEIPAIRSIPWYIPVSLCTWDHRIIRLLLESRDHELDGLSDCVDVAETNIPKHLRYGSHEIMRTDIAKLVGSI